MLDVLMETNDLNEFMTKFDMLTKVGEQDRDDLDQVKIAQAAGRGDQGTAGKRQDDSVDTGRSGCQQRRLILKPDLGQRQQMLTASRARSPHCRHRSRQLSRQRLTHSRRLPASRWQVGDEVEAAAASSAPRIHQPSGGAVGIAMQYLGVPYVWGGASSIRFRLLRSGHVCLRADGHLLPHGATAQYAAGTPIDYSRSAAW